MTVFFYSFVPIWVEQAGQKSSLAVSKVQLQWYTVGLTPGAVNDRPEEEDTHTSQHHLGGSVPVNKCD